MTSQHENIKQNKTKRVTLKAVRDNLAGGQWIMKNLNFFLFLSMLAVLYIANGHMADKTIRNINKAQNDIKELQYEYKTIKSEVMFKSQEEQILKATEKMGLKISKEVPTRLSANP